MYFNIIEVTTSRQLKSFINLPWKIYKKESYWVPPLKLTIKGILSPNHPFYQKADIKMWIAVSSSNPDNVLGRIAAIADNAHNEFHEEKAVFFGFFESKNDKKISKALFQKVEDFARSREADNIKGPMNPSTNYECGLLVEGYDDPPQIMMPYNHSYYEQLILRSNYQKEMDLYAYRLPSGYTIPPLIQKIANRAKDKNNITYRHVNMKKWDQEVELMFEIYNNAWEKNWGFVPMCREEFLNMTGEMKQIVNDKLIIFVEVNGKAAGFITALPDYNQVFKKIPTGRLLPTGILKLLRAKKYINRVRVLVMGIKREYRMNGLESVLYTKITETARELGYKEGEMGWVLESNKKMNRPLEVMGAELYKTYRIYKKNLLETEKQ